MTNEEIRDKINFNKKLIEDLLDPTTFVLQPEVQKLISENESLKNKCTHSFKDGICIYCGKNK